MCGYLVCGKGFDLSDPHYYDEEVSDCYCSEDCFRKQKAAYPELWTLQGGAETPDNESESEKEAAKYARELLAEQEDENYNECCECCEMCGVPTNNEEWVDENGTGILYCEDCYNRMKERKEKKAEDEEHAREFPDHVRCVVCECCVGCECCECEKENPCEMCGGDDEEGCCETCGRHCEECDKADVVIINNDGTKRRVKLGWCWEE